MNGKEFKKALDNIVKEKNIDPEVVDVTENENSQEEIVEELKEESNE